MRVRAATVLMSLFVLVTPAYPGDAQTARTLTVTPDSNLVDREVVLIEGSGFRPSYAVGVCQAVIAGTPGIELSPVPLTLIPRWTRSLDGLGTCGENIAVPPTDATGSFSTTFVVRRFISVGGMTIDCASPSAACGIGASEPNIAGTAVITPISFAPPSGTPRPDLIFKRRDTGSLLEDNQYFSSPSFAPLHSHSIEPGGKWTYALRVQNDGDIVDDLTITASVPLPPSSFAARFFVGYYDVTALVTGAGFTFTDVSPGAVFPLGVQFRADPTVIEGSDARIVVQVTSGEAPELGDFTRLGVKASAPT